MKSSHVFLIFVVAILLASCALMVYYRAEGFAIAQKKPRVPQKPVAGRHPPHKGQPGRPKKPLPVRAPMNNAVRRSTQIRR